MIPRGTDTGSVTVELAVLVPLLVVLTLLVIAAGRIHNAQQAVEHAAAMAARDASLARQASTATRQAETTSHHVLSQRELTCAPAEVTVDASGFASTPGELGLVEVTVRCTVTLADLGVPMLPGTTTRAGSATSPIDGFRERP
ncbi:pilus assembly protein [Haloechinothrix sp. YIM 98757]|uniref:Pilus assembly protein n=1 Tax=Haloechinothrix aidingensis TaxID=2752311 RepID=A0A838ADA0_9PSEU|nr:TadE/TadG family type IV pilus assembly protein [Haloechinothrix aidingensis]MBA0127276.1 pilus assembly protein [Haloechinothrix aidingensis]